MPRAVAFVSSVLVILGLFVPAPVAAAVPSNDLFANATPIQEAGLSDSVDLALATVEPGEPNCYSTTATGSVWYSFRAPATGALLTEVTSPLNANLRLAAYPDTGGGIATLTQVNCRLAGATITVRVAAGLTYYVQVAGISTGPGVVSLRFTFYPPPPNDNLVGATVVPALPWTDTAPLWAATTQIPGEPNPCAVSPWTATSRSVWYAFLAPASGTLTVETSGDYFVDAKVAAFREGAGWGGLDPGTCVSGSAGVPATFSIVEGRRYYIQAAAYSGWGTLTISFSFTPPAPDTTPPMISGTPVDMTVTAPGSDGAAVYYAMPTATDDVSGSVPVICVPAPFSFFSVGTTHVTCTASDAAGNVATTGFDVTVVPTPPIPVPAIIPITSYDMDDAAMSGSGCWHHVYTGVVTDLGRTFYSGGTCPPSGGHLATYRGGSGTMNDGFDARSSDEDQLVFVGQTVDQGGVVDPVITLHLDGSYQITAIRIYGGQFGNGLPGALTRATVTIGGRSVALATVEFGSPGPVGFLTGDLLDLSGTPLASVPTSTIVLHGFASAFLDQFSIAEITVDGTVAPPNTGPTVHVPADLVGEATGPGGAVATFTATASDPEDGALLATCVPASGSTFPIGATEVDCSATDSAGVSATASFTVRVMDTVPPAPFISGVASTYAVDARISITGSATDAVDPTPALMCRLTGPAATRSVPCVFDADAWSLGALGRHTIEIKSTDASNNGSQAAAEFDVVATYPSVLNLTKTWSSKAPVARDLIAILDSAAAAEKRGARAAEANKLVEYRAGVRAQSGKAFAPEKAVLLIAFSYGL